MKISPLVTDSEPAAPERGWRPGAPNVVTVVLDDVGFGQLGCFGSGLDTPNLDRLAGDGLRLTNFHTTALCAPSRASLLTGRNHHRVGFGWHPDLPMRYPGYDGRLPDEAATMADVLHAEGWATYAVGKWHLTPSDERTPAGPFTHWPTGRGFERHYGFLGGDTSQWTPCLVDDASYVDAPRSPEDGYHLNDDLADRAIGYLRDLRAYHPDRPFFLYYATGAAHAPHHAPQDWIDRYRGRFDHGWDVWREETFARQKEMGVVPADAELSPRPSWVQAWDDLSSDEQRFCARTMEVFAAFLAHTDAALGRVLDHIEAMGELDNTIVVVMSDNGASGQGGPHGSANEMRFIAQMPEDLERDLAQIDELGGWRTYNHYSWGWALAGNTPLQRWKKYTWEGGTRDPLIIRPLGCDDPGGVRDHYCHVVDIYPTVLAQCGVEVPAELRRVPQLPVDGVDLTPALRDPEHPEVRETQYYELEGSRAIYHRGWKAVTDHVYQGQVSERELVTGSHDLTTDRWLLFDTRADFAELHDLAETHPERLRELVDLWWHEAGRNNVLPLVDTVLDRLPHMASRWSAGTSRASVPAGGRVYHAGVPGMSRTDFTVSAVMARPGPLADGILAEIGDWNGGWALYARDGRVTWVINLFGVETVDLVAPAPEVRERIDLRFAAARKGGCATLLVDDEPAASVAVPFDVPGLWTPSGGFLRVGHGNGFPVDGTYRNPWPYAGPLAEVVIERHSPGTTDAALARRAMHATD
ncbi:arylsulfatase [Nocardioides sp. YIM 152588]|uniref:arylsulfatase n=1 Tax=Nocardioides sp. YIM 152588 TaxID=3158259 RepID=UPI0032E475F0